MSLDRIFCHFLLLVCWSPLPVLAAPAQPANPLQNPQEEHASRAQLLQQEYEFTQIKLRSTAEKLGQIQQELADKQAQLANLRVALGNTPTPEQQAAVENEAQRVALAELTLKSREAALTRLERKQEELRTAIEASEQAIAASRAREEAETKARNLAMQKQLQALQQENEKLRLAMEEEARRAQLAAEEAARLAEEARVAEEVRQQAIKEEEARLAEEARAAKEAATGAKAAVALREGGQTTDMSQVVLAGEPPIYQDTDTVTFTLRSRSIEAPVVMRPIGPKRYRAEVDVEPGRAFFDLRNRRYRGYFTEETDTTTYVFYYDLNAEKPVLSVVKKSVEDQMISNVKDPF